MTLDHLVKVQILAGQFCFDGVDAGIRPAPLYARIACLPCFAMQAWHTDHATSPPCGGRHQFSITEVIRRLIECSMAAKYAYWRNEQGEPHKREDEKHAPTRTIDALSSSTDFFQMKQLLPVIEGAIAILDPQGGELNQTDSSNIVCNVMHSIFGRAQSGESLSATSVLREVSKEAAAHFRRPPTQHALVTSIGVDRLPSDAIQVDGCRISALANRGSRYAIPFEETGNLGFSRYIEHSEKSRYQVLKVVTTARTMGEAIHRALTAVNLIRGLWTLAATKGSFRIAMSSRPQQPVGVIHLGPLHTVHQRGQSTWWHEPGFYQTWEIFNGGEKWEKIDAFRKQSTRLINRLPYGQQLKQLIVRYVTALDVPSAEDSSLHLWNLLEKITDTVGGPYERMIDRCSSIFSENGLVKEILSNLRTRRNVYVHSSHSHSGSDVALMWLKRIIDAHLMSLIQNRFKSESLEDYASFLQLPNDLGVIKKRLKQLRIAESFQKSVARN